MNYYSLNRQSPAVGFRTAALQGQAPDKGLYFPESIPLLDSDILHDIASLPLPEIAFRVMRAYTGADIDKEALYRICAETIDFPFPLVAVTNGISALELFHGPTLAFKDVGARFMSRCLGYFTESGGRNTTVLVATSGDTGGAVANGFLGVEGVDVVILYPSGKVSPVQELQLTTCGKNIIALEVEGSFDDCQAMVKEAFMDAELMQQRNLTSANSINIARWLPQQLYYVFAWKQWQDTGSAPVISVPSGNFGNLCAGLLAHAGGLPVQHFVAACNVNDSVVDYLSTGHYNARPAKSTLSNAMDVGNPSNFIRMLALFNNDHARITAAVTGYRVTDKQTADTMKEVYQASGYMLDPHGAVACYALAQYQASNPGVKGIFLETAHPVKFPEVVEQATGKSVPMPASAAELVNREKKSTRIQPVFDQLKQFLLS